MRTGGLGSLSRFVSSVSFATVRLCVLSGQAGTSACAATLEGLGLGTHPTPLVRLPGRRLPAGGGPAGAAGAAGTVRNHAACVLGGQLTSVSVSLAYALARQP